MPGVMKLVVLVLLIWGINPVRANAPCAAAMGCVDYGVPSHVIDLYPYPNVRQLEPSDQLLYDRIYRRVTTAVEIHDAPNGAVSSILDAGFNFVTLLRLPQDGWAEISPNRWVKTDFLSEKVRISRFAGIWLPQNPLPYPVAWILQNVRPSTEPGLDPAEETALVARYTKVNLYATIEVDGFKWYQIGHAQWVHQYDVARVIPVQRPAEVDTERWISVDLYEQVAIAYEGTTPVWATLVSSGLPQWSTNEGLFHVYRRYPRTVMSGAAGQPDFYYLEEVPWTMYFDDAIALHGTYWHDGFGYRHSHGCVNLSITDAHWLYNWSDPEFDPEIEHDEGPAVYVYSSGQYK